MASERPEPPAEVKGRVRPTRYLVGVDHCVVGRGPLPDGLTAPIDYACCEPLTPGCRPICPSRNFWTIAGSMVTSGHLYTT